LNTRPTDTDIIIKGKTETYSEPRVEKESGEFPLPIENTDKGVLIKGFEPTVQVLINVNDLGLPSANYYKFGCKDGNLYVTIEDVGKYTRYIKYAKKKAVNDIEITVDGARLQNMISNLEGEVWFSFDADKIAFSKKSKDYLLTYVMVTYQEE